MAWLAVAWVFVLVAALAATTLLLIHMIG